MRTYHIAYKTSDGKWVTPAKSKGQKDLETCFAILGRTICVTGQISDQPIRAMVVVMENWEVDENATINDTVTIENPTFAF